MGEIHGYLCALVFATTVLAATWMGMRKDHRPSALAIIFMMLVLTVMECADQLASPGQSRYFFIVESMLPLGIALYCLAYVKPPVSSNTSLYHKGVVLLGVLLPLAAIWLGFENMASRMEDFEAERILFLTEKGFYLYAALVVVTALSLVSLEHLYLRMDKPSRWRVKLEVVGIGVWGVIHVVYFGQALLYRTLDTRLIWARALAVLTGMILVCYSRAKRDSAYPIHLSKSFAYRSVLGLMIGVYFTGLALLGEGMRYIGGRWGGPVGLSVTIFLGIAGGLVLLSERLRRKVKVYLYKNFYENKYDYRQQWIKITRRLSSEASLEGVERTILEYFCDTFGVKGAALFWREENSGAFKCMLTHELDAHGYSIEGTTPLIGYLRSRDWVFDAADGDARHLGEHSELFGKTGVRFLIQIYGPKGDIEGLIALGSPVNPGEALTYEDYDLMKILARQCGYAVNNIRLALALTQASQMEAMGRISAFMMHDLKNLVSNLVLLVDNAREYMDDPEFQKDMVETLSRTVAKMTNLISRLEVLRESPGLDLARRDLMELAEEVTELMPHCRLMLTGKKVNALIDHSEIQRVLVNLVMNALEASKENTEVEIEVGLKGAPYIAVTDQGAGMDRDFIETRLFKPFSSTKKKGFGIGLYQCRKIVEAHKGRIEVESTPGVGSRFTMYLPS